VIAMFDNYSLRMLINEHGVSTTMTKYTRSAYNAATGTTGTLVTETINVKAYFYEADTDRIRSDSIRDDRRHVAVSPNNPVDFDDGDGTEYKITSNGRQLSVMLSSVITSANQPMVYLLKVVE
jgi:hypothetical protein